MLVDENEPLDRDLRCPIPLELYKILRSYPTYLSRLQDAFDQFAENLPGGEFSREKYGPAYRRLMDMVCAELNKFHIEASQELDAVAKDVRLSKSAVDQIKIDFSCELAEKKFRDFSAFPVYRGYFSDLSPVVKYLVSRGK
ncbi:hypothetical protein [Xanthomonas campestris]|jgi:hypothetical protein|uniref:Uncharacterized protein n=1 Tax=Xanthomonas campestris pv. campestris (strain B100) TaxID=509169 RepID=B0RNN8_XANCB|nr:hypothetical protein [Xanthomonas campestris]MCC3254657.1 hypothetical protein [Xanthomonas campestris pv. armoraciae]MCC5051009.1 hypothetical protein [Xanthomonas campestris pv. aberrans]MCD0248254.1 hypothetical protein [Xanthomonas campestris pv. campestris]MCD0255844.1 hypothetical protein [Xanthomonas campestris pv. campestris]MCD0260641.1 hypothetical protein [Xanthomonas campestris pv. campestris]